MNNFIWNKDIDNILREGIFLDSLRIKNWALYKEYALKAIDHILKLNIPILGGDVCEIDNGNIELNYDNWYCEKKSGESDSDFIKRSAIQAKKYINDYNNENIDKILFILILDA